jgi:hypothetical protein
MAGVFLPAGYQMTMTASSVKAGSYTNVTNPDSYTVLSAGSSATVGPFAAGIQYEVIDLSYSQSSYIVAPGDLYAPSAETNIAEIANDADGTEIASAVNSILGILVANGLMAAPE